MPEMSMLICADVNIYIFKIRYMYTLSEYVFPIKQKNKKKKLSFPYAVKSAVADNEWRGMIISIDFVAINLLDFFFLFFLLLSEWMHEFCIYGRIVDFIERMNFYVTLQFVHCSFTPGKQRIQFVKRFPRIKMLIIGKCT